MSCPLSASRLLLCALMTLCWGLVACTEEPPDDDDDIYEVPDDDDVVVPAPGDENWPCDDPEQCRVDLGCDGGVCRACDEASDCQSLRGCDEGVCGSCSLDEHCRDGEGCTNGFCLPTAIPQWELTIAPEDVLAMDVDVRANLFVPASLVVDGVAYEGLQVRYAGGSTRRFPKKSFRIEFPEDADHPGFARKINLRGEYNDPSYLRSFVGYETARRLAGLTTARARYLNLVLNGENRGLMLEVERIGGKFLELNGRDREQSLYEAYEASSYGAFVPLESPTDYRAHYEKDAGDRDDFSDLISLIEDALWGDYVDSPPWGPTLTERTRAVIDVDSYVDYLAFMALLQNNDHITNNFYFSWQEIHRLGPRWEFYPWDLDLSFGCQFDAVLGSLCPELVHDDWWMNGILYDPLVAGIPNENWFNLAIHLVLRDPELLARFETTICEWSVGPWWTTELPALIDALGQTLESRVEDDVVDQNADLAAWDAARPDVLDFIPMRAA